jgi:hypothetical protein
MQNNFGYIFYVIVFILLKCAIRTYPLNRWLSIGIRGTVAIR